MRSSVTDAHDQGDAVAPFLADVLAPGRIALARRRELGVGRRDAHADDAPLVHVVDDGAGDREQSARGELGGGLERQVAQDHAGLFLALGELDIAAVAPTQQHFTLQQVVGRGKLRVVGRVLDVDRADEVGRLIRIGRGAGGRRLGQFAEFGRLVAGTRLLTGVGLGWSELGLARDRFGGADARLTRLSEGEGDRQSGDRDQGH